MRNTTSKTSPSTILQRLNFAVACLIKFRTSYLRRRTKLSRFLWMLSKDISFDQYDGINVIFQELSTLTFMSSNYSGIKLRPTEWTCRQFFPLLFDLFKFPLLPLNDDFLFWERKNFFFSFHCLLKLVVEGKSNWMRINYFFGTLTQDFKSNWD